MPSLRSHVQGIIGGKMKSEVRRTYNFLSLGTLASGGKRTTRSKSMVKGIQLADKKATL